MLIYLDHPPIQLLWLDPEMKKPPLASAIAMLSLAQSEQTQDHRQKLFGVLSILTCAGHGCGKHCYKTRFGLHIPLSVTVLGKKKT